MRVVKIIMMLLLVVALVDCRFFTEGMAIDPDSAQGIIIEQSVDTFGYTLGLFAAKDPTFRKKVEEYYNKIKEQGFTVAIVNEILRQFRDEDVAYQVLAYKMVSLIRVLGGQLDSDGAIQSFGTISKEYIEIGKNAYLIAIQNAKDTGND